MTQRFWQRCDDGWTVDSTTRRGWQGSRAMQINVGARVGVCPLQVSCELAPRGLMRIGLQHDMTFVGSAAALNRSWNKYRVPHWPTCRSQTPWLANAGCGRVGWNSLRT